MIDRLLRPSTWFAVLVAIFLLTPILLVVLFSFGKNQLTTFPMGGVTLDWYREVFDWPQFWSALKTTVAVSGTVGLASAITGTLAALGLIKLKEKTAGVAISTLGLPLMLPPLVIGLALLTCYSLIGMPLGRISVILAHLVYTQPFVIAVVHARLRQMDYAAVEAARDCGATPLQAFMTVTLPVARASIIGGALIAMALSLDDFVITFFTLGGGNTLSTLIWGMLRTTIDPTINAVGTVIICLTIGMTAIALWVTRYRG
ncbi:ABC transporter permease [Methyloligella sp. 2.7D]|uniref:ABC transporter permease n=1 Tax=unclassified Methyloligella TaxID=2625955 RepID=UPI00157BE3E7|nr:ABC transporter permease [Methyloligella sp. GL2]QKP76005.1 ABC transporter permease [Methyloligella sp. GL2]